MLSNITECPSLRVGSYTLQLEIDTPLDEKYVEIARKELRETPDRVKEATQELKELLKEEKDLKVPLDNEAWLKRFLRPCKYYPESALKLVKSYYAFKKKHNDIYKDLIFSKQRNIFEQDLISVVACRDLLGRRILILEAGKKWKPSKCTLDEIFICIAMFTEILLYEDMSSIAGAVVIFDMEGLSLSQVWHYTPAYAKRVIDFLQDSLPVRVKNVHIVNQPYVFNMVFALFKPFLREKLKNRIIFHGSDRKSLHKYLDPSCLFPCYGGTLEQPRITGMQWYELLMKYDDELKAISSYGYDKAGSD